MSAAGLKLEIIRRIYGAGAAAYDDVMAAGWRTLADRNRLIGSLQPAHGERYLELGVGTGLNIPHYLDGSRYVGIDTTAPMLRKAVERCSQRTDVDLCFMDGTHLGFSDGTFSGVIACLSLSACQDPLICLREGLRVTRPSGRLVIMDVVKSPFEKVANIQTNLIAPYATTTGFPPPSEELPGGVIVYDPGLDMEQLVMAAGWQLTSIEILDRENPFTCRAYMVAERPQEPT